MSTSPLIWRFAEVAEEDDQETSSYYDRAADLNVIHTNGSEQPLVSYQSQNLATMTGTAVKREDTDQDFVESASALGTVTITKAKQEETDSD